jgi:hypothetical protein
MSVGALLVVLGVLLLVIAAAGLFCCPMRCRASMRRPSRARCRSA